jgi:protease-4
MSNRSVVWKFLSGLWRGLDRLRKAVHLFFMLLVLMILLAALAPERAAVPLSAALVIAPQGTLVEQLSGDPLQRALAQVQGTPLQETLLKDVLDALRAAKDDSRIGAVVLQLDNMSGAGLSKLQDIADELSRFKESGKPVIALGSGFDQAQYFLAAQADEIYMHPMGSVIVDGYSRYIPYYKSALEKLYIDYEVWTVGEFKSFVEPITRDSMSEEDKRASGAYLAALWNSYQADVTAARGLPADGLQRYADNAVDLLRAADGDMAALAVDYGLVDSLLTRDRMRMRIRDIVGGDETDDGGFTGIDQSSYMAARHFVDAPAAGEHKIAVVVASGEILDGMQPPGTVGGDSTAQLLRQVANDERVKALVLRIDSPGGSAFASEVIAREVAVFQESDRPVVVSMGSVAASGGYWIAMGADQIWASPSTLTGSIGVGATVPTFPRTLERLGVNIDGIGTTALSGGFDLTQGLNDSAKEIIAQSVSNTYRQFIGKVAESRGREAAEIDAIARGRVWVGSQALENGLVDRLGGIDDAIASAAALAGVADATYSVEYVEPQLSVAQRLLLDLFGVAAPVLSNIGLEPRLPRALSQLLEAARRPLAFVERLNDPRGIYAYCFCDVQ